MKNRLSGVCVIVGLLAICTFTACRTDKPGIDEPPAISTKDMATIAELAAYTGTLIHLTDNESDRGIFAAVEQSLAVALDANDYDPVKFANTLQALPIKELQGSKGSIILGSAVILWRRYSTQVVALDREKQVRPVIEAVHRGLADALIQSLEDQG